MTRIKLRNMTRQEPKKKEAFNYDVLMEQYRTAEDHNLMERLLIELDLELFGRAHADIYCLWTDCLHPQYIRDRIYALNVFEGCCYNNLSLKEKRLAVAASLFKSVGKTKAREVIKKHTACGHISHSNQLLDNETFVENLLNLVHRKAKPKSSDLVIAMVLWDARHMYLYNKDIDKIQFLCDLFSDKELTEPSVNLQITKLVNANCMTNWARIKSYKLNWPSVVKDIFKHIPTVKKLLMA
jgi:hypothetical protein